MKKNELNITIAGASGFVGRSLIDALQEDYNLKGLSRSTQKSKNINWVEADLFSFQSIRKALENTDIAIYLVHSMLPSSRLFQGNFQDTDLLIADNFANACMENNVSQIIYLGGLVPSENMSPHLESRKEVEEVFKSTGIPTTILRTGMVVGDGGSSFEILKNLSHNLPLMILPLWTSRQTQAIFIDDLVRIFSCVIDNETYKNRTIDIVNGESITYKDLIEQSSRYFIGKKILISVPINYTSFSKLWVSIFGRSDYELVSPLIDSLLCDLPDSEVPAEIKDLIEFKSFESMLLKTTQKRRHLTKRKRKQQNNTVRSIQRLSNDMRFDVDVVSDEYVKWLPKKMRNFIQVKHKSNLLSFELRGLRKPLLILQRQGFEDELDRVKFHIVGGLLSKTSDTGWLEFRKVIGGEFTLASINEFVPSLPWYIYIYTQAIVHLRVMNSFSKHLSKTKR